MDNTKINDNISQSQKDKEQFMKEKQDFNGTQPYEPDLKKVENLEILDI